jgi:hypothetical protein
MNTLSKIVLSLSAALALAATARAEDSEAESSREEYDLAASLDPLPPAAARYLAQLAEIDARFPDGAAVDTEALLAAEGERLALAYCATIGFDAGCTLTTVDGVERFVSLDDAGANSAAGAKGSSWWEWIKSHLFNVGVIPEQDACPAPFARTEIYMDDEDRRNANARSGWQGATVSTNNTRYRFCRLDMLRSLQYRPLSKEGNETDYAVLNMGLLCPSGARRVLRIEENELWRNQNSSQGDIFPNFRIYNTWFNFYCHFDGGASSILGRMDEFPRLGFAYGVFAPSAMPAPFALEHGSVYQDDEDVLNWNAWPFGSGDPVMNGTRNTWRGLAKVRRD